LPNPLSAYFLFTSIVNDIYTIDKILIDKTIEVIVLIGFEDSGVGGSEVGGEQWI
jgi:hypothetical protein